MPIYECFRVCVSPIGDAKCLRYFKEKLLVDLELVEVKFRWIVLENPREVDECLRDSLERVVAEVLDRSRPTVDRDRFVRPLIEVFLDALRPYVQCGPPTDRQQCLDGGPDLSASRKT